MALDVDDGPENSPGADDNFWSEVYGLPVCVKSPSIEPGVEVTSLARTALAELERAIESHDYDVLAGMMDIPVMIDYLLIHGSLLMSSSPKTSLSLSAMTASE